VTTVTGDTAFDSGPYDMWNQWQQEYEELQQQINAQGGGTTTATGPGKTAGHPVTLPWKPGHPVPIPRPPVPPRAPWPPKPKPKPQPWPPQLPKPKRPKTKRNPPWGKPWPPKKRGR
jgi:hypothetical protein